MDELLTLATLFSVPAAALVTLAIVQAIKPFKWLQSIDTRLIALIIAAILMQVGAYFMGSGLEMHLIALFNTFFTLTSAMGMYEMTFRKGDDAKKLTGGGG